MEDGVGKVFQKQHMFQFCVHPKEHRTQMRSLVQQQVKLVTLIQNSNTPNPTAQSLAQELTVCVCLCGYDVCSQYLSHIQPFLSVSLYALQTYVNMFVIWFHSFTCVLVFYIFAFFLCICFWSLIFVIFSVTISDKSKFFLSKWERISCENEDMNWVLLQCDQTSLQHIDVGYHHRRHSLKWTNLLF